MSGLKKFLDRRAETIAREKAKKEKVKYVPPKKTETEYQIDKDKGIIKTEKEVEEKIEAPNLTDDEFWTISNKFMKESKQSNQTAVEVLQKILEDYTPLKIKQFAQRYEELNK